MKTTTHHFQRYKCSWCELDYVVESATPMDADAQKCRSCGMDAFPVAPIEDQIPVAHLEVQTFAKTAY